VNERSENSMGDNLWESVPSHAGIKQRQSKRHGNSGHPRERGGSSRKENLTLNIDHNKTRETFSNQKGIQREGGLAHGKREDTTTSRKGGKDLPIGQGGLLEWSSRYKYQDFFKKE